MLVLTRQIEESVVVGNSEDVAKLIKVTVVSVDGGRVRLGFEAPGEVPILRWEVWQRVREKRRENKRTKCTVVPIV
jgi:carbon storage regulator